MKKSFQIALVLTALLLQTLTGNAASYHPIGVNAITSILFRLYPSKLGTIPTLPKKSKDKTEVSNGQTFPEFASPNISSKITTQAISDIPEKIKKKRKIF